VQIADADELLARPADEFVASFVGADRGLKRLRVRTLEDIELGAPISDDSLPSVPRDISLHYALSMMLAEGRTSINVTENDNPVGSVSMDAITRLIAPEGESNTAVSRGGAAG
jgi:osmoprotectant transport system ATP-binding protein